MKNNVPTTHPLLIEIGTEELPPTSLQELATAFTESFCSALTQEQLTFEGIETFATPRRLALLFSAVPTFQADRKQTRRGPLVQNALKDGTPTPALLGFAKSCGVSLEQLRTEPSDKGEVYVYHSKLPGCSLSEVLQRILPETLKALPIPKRMRWGNETEAFIRPVQWLLALHGEAILALEIFSLKATRQTLGHRIHHAEAISLKKATDYKQALKQACVIACLKEREEIILAQVQEVAVKQKAKPILPQALLQELVGLVEWPKALLISFEARFLALPKEVLVTVMQKHQRYIALEDNHGNLLNQCIVITNQTFEDPSVVIAGNQRVIRARFEDASFFYQQDQQVSLWARQSQLQQLVFQEKLGTISEKAARLIPLVKYLATHFALPEAISERAALLAKTDLVTQMVYEFPELQGIMGQAYALHQQEELPICHALYEQYLPRSAKDLLPKSPLGICLALADRLDTLVGIFGIGLSPTGSKDPFGLRRAMLAILRILLQGQLPFDLLHLLKLAQTGYGNRITPKTSDLVLQFAYERFYSYFAEEQISKTVIDAVLALNPSQPYDIAKRVKAIAQFKEQSQALILAAANKRIANILSKAELNQSNITPSLLTHSAEKQLYAVFIELKQQIKPLYEQQAYEEVLQALVALEAPLEQFFNEVLVMAEEPALRHNRLSLLHALREQCLLVGDLSCLS